MRGLALICPRCGRRFSVGEQTVCPEHESGPDSCEPADSDDSPQDVDPVQGDLSQPVDTGDGGDRPTLELVYDLDTLREMYDPTCAMRTDIWRYQPFLPVDGPPVTLGEGWTALATASNLGEDLGVTLSLKLEDANPTGATKDRGTAVVATYARERSYDTLACASTGNAAASTAAYAAHGGLSCSLFVPGQLPEPKAIQPLVYGADIHRIEGVYGDAVERCRQVVNEHNWVDRSAGASPYAPAGARTLGFELAEQTSGYGDRDETTTARQNEMGVPEWVVVPVGNGGTIAGVWEGFQTFFDLGYVEATPRMLGVQAADVSTIHDAFQTGRDTADSGNDSHGNDTGDSGQTETTATTTTTCADSIAVSRPHHRREACAALAESGGDSVTVSDAAILESIRRLGRTEGVFAEPASASVVAGIETARESGIIDAGDRVVAVITGTGLKDPASVLDSFG